MFAPMNSMNLPIARSPETIPLTQSRKNADSSKQPKMGRDHREFLSA